MSVVEGNRCWFCETNWRLKTLKLGSQEDLRRNYLKTCRNISYNVIEKKNLFPDNNLG